MDTTGITGTPVEPAHPAADPGFADLTWLLHRAAQRMRAAMDDVARSHGLAGARDWLVLSAISTGPPQTQLALAQALGLDKTTLTSLLDRLESRGFVIRSADSHDRRARIPSLTPSGQSLERRIARARDETEATALCEFTDTERQLLRDLLSRVAADGDAGSRPTGSCI